MSRPKIVFVTYYRLVPTGQIGIFKRCLRLMSRLLDRFEIHQVNFGPLPKQDPLFASVEPHVTFHTVDNAPVLGQKLEEVFSELDPVAIVIGEAPMRGSMRTSSLVARRLGIWQIALDNFYGELCYSELPERWPQIDRWLLLGLTSDGAPNERHEHLLVTPPLVQFPETNGAGRDRITVIGYDQETLINACRLLRRLPSDLPVDFFIAPQWQATLVEQGLDLEAPHRRVLVLPPDHEIYSSMRRSRFLFGKAGFQQVVEGIALGAPIVCQACGGGLADYLVATYLKPYVRFVESDAEFGRLLLDLAGWLLEPPDSPWARLPERVEDPIELGAEQLTLLIEEGRGSA